jgi:serine/threonine protein kinase
LKREAILLRRMAHPNIVHLYGQGEFEKRPYLVQEYLHGPSLLELIDCAENRRLTRQSRPSFMLRLASITFTRSGLSIET